MDGPSAGSFYQNYFVNGAEFNSMIKCWGTAGSLTLIMSGCKMTEMSVPSPLEGNQEQTFTFVPKKVYPVAYDSIAKYNAW